MSELWQSLRSQSELPQTELLQTNYDNLFARRPSSYRPNYDNLFARRPSSYRPSSHKPSSHRPSSYRPSSYRVSLQNTTCRSSLCERNSVSEENYAATTRAACCSRLALRFFTQPMPARPVMNNQAAAGSGVSVISTVEKLIPVSLKPSS